MMCRDRFVEFRCSVYRCGIGSHVSGRLKDAGIDMGGSRRSHVYSPILRDHSGLVLREWRVVGGRSQSMIGILVRRSWPSWNYPDVQRRERRSLFDIGCWCWIRWL